MTEVMKEPEYITERVTCCVCNGSGKVSRFILFKRDCSVCEGSGQREILIHSALTAEDRELVRLSAITGSLNYHPPSLLWQLTGLRL